MTVFLVLLLFVYLLFWTKEFLCCPFFRLVMDNFNIFISSWNERKAPVFRFGNEVIPASSSLGF